jgi:ATP-dependent Zn protease
MTKEKSQLSEMMKQNEQNLFKFTLLKFASFFIRAGIFLVFAYAITIFMRTLTSRAMMDNFTFDFKQAQDIE